MFHSKANNINLKWYYCAYKSCSIPRSYDQPTGCNDVRTMIQTTCLENLVYLELAIKIIKHSLIAEPNTTAKVWKFLDFSADLPKTIAGFIAEE